MLNGGEPVYGLTTGVGERKSFLLDPAERQRFNHRLVLNHRIAQGDEEAVKLLAGLLERGGAGVARIPGKQGGPALAYAVVQVVIGDRPGELARLFQAAGEAGVNIEDVRIEHSAGLPAGVAELAVRPEAAGELIEALAAGGWPVRR